MRVFRLRWAWLLGPLLPVYAVGLPLLFLGVDRLLVAAGTGGADGVLFAAAVGLGTAAVLANARRDKVVVGDEGLRLSEGDAPVDLVAPWSAVEGVRRARRGPLRVDVLVLSQVRVVRRDPAGRAGLRGPLRERAFQRERARRGTGRPAEVVLTRYGRGGWVGPLGEAVRRHRPDLAPAPAQDG